MKDEADPKKAERMIRILLLLMAKTKRLRKYSAKDLYEHFKDSTGMSLRTIQRYVRMLHISFPEIIQRTKKQNTPLYSVKEDLRHQFTMPLECNGLLALFMLKRLQPFFAPEARTLRQITDTLENMGDLTGDEIFMDLDRLFAEKTHIFGERALLSPEGEMLDNVLNALAKKRVLRIIYCADPAQGGEEREICPVRLFLSGRELYMAGVFEKNKRDCYYFKICRILDAEVLDREFRLSDSEIKAVDNRLLKSFGILDNKEDVAVSVGLKFPGWFGRLLTERKYHPTQKVRFDRNGDAVCTMKVPIGRDLVRWILSWHDIVTVLKPKKLKDEVQNAARSFIGRHAG